MRFLRRWAPLLSIAFFALSRRRRKTWAAQTLGLAPRTTARPTGLPGTLLGLARFVGLRELGYFSLPMIALRFGLRFLRRRSV